MDPTPDIVLASGSRYRAELLQRLNLPFRQSPPEVDEAMEPGESPVDYVHRLALAKARAAAPDQPALVIGSDQAAVIDNRVLGKPGSIERACEQLQLAAGREVMFLTGLCLWDSRTQQPEIEVVPFYVEFRALGAEEIRRYVELDLPLDCAGSFRAEGFGVTLFERMSGDDPSALIGLPLIALCRLLRRAGVALP